MLSSSTSPLLLPLPTESPLPSGIFCDLTFKLYLVLLPPHSVNTPTKTACYLYPKHSLYMTRFVPWFMFLPLPGLLILLHHPHLSLSELWLSIKAYFICNPMKLFLINRNKKDLWLWDLIALLFILFMCLFVCFILTILNLEKGSKDSTKKTFWISFAQISQMFTLNFLSLFLCLSLPFCLSVSLPLSFSIIIIIHTYITFFRTIWKWQTWSHFPLKYFSVHFLKTRNSLTLAQYNHQNQKINVKIILLSSLQTLSRFVSGSNNVFIANENLNYAFLSVLMCP